MALEAVNVHGGYRIMDVTWFRNRDEDMDADFDWIEESETLYPSKDEADAALAKIVAKPEARHGDA